MQAEQATGHTVRRRHGSDNAKAKRAAQLQTGPAADSQRRAAPPPTATATASRARARHSVCSKAQSSLSVGAWLALAGCGTPVALEPHAAAEAHAISPLPVCVSPIDSAPTAQSGRPSGDLAAWQLVFPTLAGKRPQQLLNWPLATESVDQQLRDCTGAIPSTRLGEFTPLPLVRDAQLTWAAENAGGLRAVWLRTHQSPSARQAGPLAVLGRGRHPTEVFALGVFAGDENTTFELITFGDQLFVAAVFDGCSRTNQQGACVTRMDLLAASKGQLWHRGSIDLQAKDKPDNAKGGAMQRFTTTHHLEPSGIRLHEVLVDRDALGRELRRAERDRFVDVLGSRLEATAPALWAWAPESQVASPPAASAPTARATPKSIETPPQPDPQSRFRN